MEVRREAPKCEAAVFHPRTGRQVARCEEYADWRLTARMTGIARRLCERHKADEIKPGAFDMERLPRGFRRAAG